MTASAAIFCVSAGPSLQNALTQAATNGQNDEIRLRPGTYTMGSGTTAFTYTSSEAFRLVVSGGWQTVGAIPCALPAADPNLSVLDGVNQRRVMDLLRIDSPFLDTGDGALSAGDIDLDGNARANGRGRDVGAYELPYQVFGDGFESDDD